MNSLLYVINDIPCREKVSEILAYSREEAVRLSCSSVSPEHLLLGMMRMKDGLVCDVFSRLNIKKEDIKFSLEMQVQESEGIIHPLNSQEILLNEQASNILKLSVLEARRQHEQHVDQQHLLLAILRDRGNNGAKQILEEHNMTYDNILNMFKAPQTNDALQLPEDEEEDTELEPLPQEDVPSPVVDLTDYSQGAPQPAVAPVVAEKPLEIKNANGVSSDNMLTVDVAKDEDKATSKTLTPEQILSTPIDPREPFTKYKFPSGSSRCSES